jgi:hypothetical protein
MVESGNYKCIERGYGYCNNSVACPLGLYCDERNGKYVCSEVQDNDPAVKEDLLRRYWGETGGATTCNDILMQESASATTKEDDAFSPPVEVHRPPAQFWYAQKLVVKSPAIKIQNTTLPSVQAAKVCQHLKVVNSTAIRDFCFLANTNGHFLNQDRPRVTQLIDEYMRRMCHFQSCEGQTGNFFEFVPEEINPCPCRQPPPPPPGPGPNLDVAAGAPDILGKAEVVAEAEQQQANTTSMAPPQPAAFEQPDEKPIAIIKIREVSSGATPLSAEAPLEDPQAFQLILPNHNGMDVKPELDLNPHIGDGDMLVAHRPETFMGKEACEEDVAENAVDLDGQSAIQMDKSSDSRPPTDITVADMNTEIASKSVMPDADSD